MNELHEAQVFFGYLKDEYKFDNGKPVLTLFRQSL